MNTHLARSYLALDYDLHRADESLARLQQTLSSLPCQDAARAGAAVAMVRAMLALAMHPLDGALAEAARLVETLGPAPF